jgi:hypothetical protein
MAEPKVLKLKGTDAREGRGEAGLAGWVAGVVGREVKYVGEGGSFGRYG